MAVTLGAWLQTRRSYYEGLDKIKSKGFSTSPRSYTEKKLINKQKVRIPVGFNQSSSSGRIRYYIYRDCYLYTYSYPVYNTRTKYNMDIGNSYKDDSLDDKLGGKEERLG